ncbi:MAG: universal stress protein [Actinomycetes bacterium]
MNLRSVVVGVDGSANGRRALEWALGVAAPVGARVVAVHALGLLTHVGGHTVPVEGRRDEITAAFRDDWCGPTLAGARPDECTIHDGTPTDVLLAAARTYAADLVVVGARGAGGHALLGSTSTRVVHEAGRPVLVVPESDDRD